jgi:hypothetical protein
MDPNLFKIKRFLRLSLPASPVYPQQAGGKNNSLRLGVSNVGDFLC